MGETAKKALTAEQIKAVGGVKTKWVDVPAWGGGVYVRTLKAGEAIDDFDPVNIVVAASQDETGAQVFSETDKEWLRDSQIGPVRQVYNAALVLSGIVSDAQTVEGEAKN